MYRAGAQTIGALGRTVEWTEGGVWRVYHERHMDVVGLKAGKSERNTLTHGPRGGGLKWGTAGQTVPMHARRDEIREGSLNRRKVRPKQTEGLCGDRRKCKHVGGCRRYVTAVAGRVARPTDTRRPGASGHGSGGTRTAMAAWRRRARTEREVVGCKDICADWRSDGCAM